MPNQRRSDKRSVNAWIPVELADELAKEARRRNCSRSDIVREILKAAVAKKTLTECRQDLPSPPRASPQNHD